MSVPRRPIVLAALSALVLLAGCRGDRSDKPPRQFFPDMDDAPKWKPQGESGFFADGRTMRKPVPGTVPHSRWSLASLPGQPEFTAKARVDLLKPDDALYQGKTGPEDYLTWIPIPVDRDLIARGSDRFNIYCSVCHGYQGDGQGEVAKRWTMAIPSFHDERYKDRAQRTGKDGYLYWVIRHGVPKADGTLSMPSYAHALDERDAWAVVAYLRALQATREGDLSDVPEAQRGELERARRAPGTGATP